MNLKDFCWRYVDIRQIVVSAIRDYPYQLFIVETTPSEIKLLSGDIESPVSSKVDGMPKPKNGIGQDRMLIKAIDRKSIASERYEDALFFINWFVPAWDSLSDIERHILTNFYLSENRKSGVTRALARELNYSESWIERKRAKALRSLKQSLVIDIA